MIYMQHCVICLNRQDSIKEAPSEVPSSVIPRLLYVIGTGIDDEDILQKILDILLFLTELKMVDNADVLLIENVSTLLCVGDIDIF